MNKSKLKGSNFERSIVNYLKGNGIHAKRAYASNGQSLGKHEEVDVLVHLPLVEDRVNTTTKYNEYKDEFKIQCKVRKKLPKVFGLTEHVDAVVFKEDRGDIYIMMKLESFIKRILK